MSAIEDAPSLHFVVLLHNNMKTPSSSSSCKRLLAE
jgi:hypothetical protein